MIITTLELFNSDNIILDNIHYMLCFREIFIALVGLKKT